MTPTPPPGASDAAVAQTVRVSTTYQRGHMLLVTSRDPDRNELIEIEQAVGRILYGADPLTSKAEGAAEVDRGSPFYREPLPEVRDVPKSEQGLFRKFDVRRTDGSDAPGGKHHGCEYFVLDIEHDKRAIAALEAYSDVFDGFPGSHEKAMQAAIEAIPAQPTSIYGKGAGNCHCVRPPGHDGKCDHVTAQPAPESVIEYRAKLVSAMELADKDGRILNAQGFRQAIDAVDFVVSAKAQPAPVVGDHYEYEVEKAMPFIDEYGKHHVRVSYWRTVGDAGFLQHTSFCEVAHPSDSALLSGLLNAALSARPAVEGGHGHAAASDELATKEVLVPCDCGCGRQCCAMCGNDLGFIAVQGAQGASGGEWPPAAVWNEEWKGWVVPHRFGITVLSEQSAIVWNDCRERCMKASPPATGSGGEA